MKCKLCGYLLVPYGKEWASGQLSSYHVECLIEAHEEKEIGTLIQAGEKIIFDGGDSK